MRVAVLGAGRMGRRRAHLLASDPRVDEVVVGNRTRARAEEVARAVGGRAADLEEALEAGPEAVVVSLATANHAEYLLRAIDLGVPVLTEKPLAADLDGTWAAVAAARDAGVAVQVAFMRRFDPAYVEAGRLVASGALGTLYHVHMTSHDRDVTPLEYLPGSGGIFRDLHVHDFDAARFLTGREIAEVDARASVRAHARFAEYDDFDTAAVLATMDDGLTVTVSGARHDPLGYDFRVELFGSADSVATGLGPRTPLRSLEPGGPGAPPHAYEGFLERFAAAFEAETAAFVDLITGRGPNPCPPEEAARAMAAAVACERSVAERRPVALSEVEVAP